MKILSYELTPETEALVSSLTASLSRKVTFLESDALPEQARNVFGYINTVTADETYQVSLSTLLSRAAFECTLLHQLRHLVQIEENYPNLFLKDCHETVAPDPTLVEGRGAHIAAAILDLDVNTWLHSVGRWEGSYARANLDAALASSGQSFTGFKLPLLFASFAVSILNVSLQGSDEDAARVFEAYAAYPDVVAAARTMREKLLSRDVCSADGAIWGMGLVLDTLDLWKYFYVAAPDGKKLRTHGEFLALDGAASD